MKKMTKGAIVAGLGVALLLGGGGTLAVWNADVQSNAGTIAAGDLNLRAQRASWTSDVSGPIANINTYRVVPGETLTLTQVVDVTLRGDNLTATLVATGEGTNGANGRNLFQDGNVTVSDVTLTNGDGRVLEDTVLSESGTVTAATSFTFDADNRESVNARYSFSTVRYQLQQQAPVAAQN